jgi:hypothetical protein
MRKQTFTSWQDLVLTLGQFVFFASLIPTILSVQKPPLWTSIPTAFILTVYVPTLWTLRLHVSVCATILVAVAWWIIAYQSWVT